MAEGQTQKYFEDQLDDEEVLYVFRKHPIVMRKGIVAWAIAMLVGPLYTVALTFIYANNPEKYPTPEFFLMSMLVSLGLSLIVFFPSWMAWYYSVFIVTDQRFIQITQKGLFHRSVVDVGLNQIQMVNYEVAGLQETMMGFGTIMMQTYMGELLIHEVHHPARIQKKILKILRDKGIISTSAAGFPAATGADN
jgi:hypothetical protein